MCFPVSEKYIYCRFSNTCITDKCKSILAQREVWQEYYRKLNNGRISEIIFCMIQVHGKQPTNRVQGPKQQSYPFKKGYFFQKSLSLLQECFSSLQADSDSKQNQWLLERISFKKLLSCFGEWQADLLYHHCLLPLSQPVVSPLSLLLYSLLLSKF